MKNHRSIVIILAIVVGIFSGLFVYFHPQVKPATEEDYEYLKGACLEVAKTLDKTCLDDETLRTDFNFNENELVVTVESWKAKVTATFPVSSLSSNVNNEVVILQREIKLENVQYKTKNLLSPTWLYSIVCLMFAIAVAIAVAMVIYSLYRLVINFYIR